MFFLTTFKYFHYFDMICPRIRLNIKMYIIEIQLTNIYNHESNSGELNKLLLYEWKKSPKLKRKDKGLSWAKQRDDLIIFKVTWSHIQNNVVFYIIYKLNDKKYTISHFQYSWSKVDPAFTPKKLSVPPDSIFFKSTGTKPEKKNCLNQEKTIIKTHA